MNFFLLALSLVLVANVTSQDDLELRVQVLEAEVIQITDNVEDVEDDVSLNSQQLFEVTNDVDDIDAQTDAQELRIGAVEEENSVLRLRLEQVETLLSSLSTQVGEHDVEIHALNETVSDLDIDNSTNERLDALESDVTNLESDVTTLEGGFTQLESDVTALEGDVTTLESDVTTLISDVMVVESSVEVLNTTTDQRLDELEENSGGVDYAHTAFLATGSTPTFVPSDPIVWDTAILNPGGHYNPESGIYTVPLDGIYQFVMHYKNSGDTCTGAWLEVDNIRTVYTQNCDNDRTDHVDEMTVLLALTSGQQVWISPSGIEGLQGTDSNGTFGSWFSGHLVYPL